ncbi:MAG: hypothetical protein C4331_03250 [Meiothermus sp.]
MLSYPIPTPTQPPLPHSDDLGEALAIGRFLLQMPCYSLEFAREAVQKLSFVYTYGLQQENYALMSLACKCLQLGWVKANRAAAPRSWEYRHLQSHPGLAHRPNPKVAQLFYQAYLNMIEDPNYCRMRAQGAA